MDDTDDTVDTLAAGVAAIQQISILLLCKDSKSMEIIMKIQLSLTPGLLFTERAHT